MEIDISNEYKEYLSNEYGTKLNSKMKTLPLMYWIPKIYYSFAKMCTKTFFKGYHYYI